MKEQEVRGIFALAGIPILALEPLPDGYGYPVSDPRYYEEPPRLVWWFVKTGAGWIKIGWRKRVINIDWSDTGIKADVTKDDTTKGDHLVHAWTEEDAVKYLKALAPHLQASAPLDQSAIFTAFVRYLGRKFLEADAKMLDAERRRNFAEVIQHNGARTALATMSVRMDSIAKSAHEQRVFLEDHTSAANKEAPPCKG